MGNPCSICISERFYNAIKMLAYSDVSRSRCEYFPRPRVKDSADDSCLALPHVQTLKRLCIQQLQAGLAHTNIEPVLASVQKLDYIPRFFIMFDIFFRFPPLINANPFGVVYGRRLILWVEEYTMYVALST